MMNLLTAVIITYNEEGNIERCIRSVKPVADEIIVLDSFSTDETVTIARSLGAIVHQHAFSGYAAQKNRALTYASNNFILSLDADEELSKELQESVLKVKKDPRFSVYRMNRDAFYCGSFIQYGTWFAEPKIRLFDRTKVKWGGLDPHDRIICPPGLATGKLVGSLNHYICNTLDQHRRRSENFSSIAASSLYNLGQKTNRIKIVASPAWFFIFDYIIRGGILSGWRGYRIATIQARYHYLKYLKLFRLQNGKTMQGVGPGNGTTTGLQNR